MEDNGTACVGVEDYARDEVLAIDGRWIAACGEKQYVVETSRRPTSNDVDSGVDITFMMAYNIRR